MNRREKQQAVNKLAEQWNRPHTKEFIGGIYNPDYRSGWKDAIRAAAVALGLYDDFLKRIENYDAKEPKDEQ